MSHFGIQKPPSNLDVPNLLTAKKFTKQISLNGLIVALKLNRTNPALTPRYKDKYKAIRDFYKRLVIRIDMKGYMWVQKHPDDESLVLLRYNTLTSFLRNDYKEWCEDFNILFINAEFKFLFDQVIYDVLVHTKYLYAHPELAKEQGALKEELMDNKRHL